MTQPIRPECPCCGLPVDKMRHSVGVFCAYPCNCWLTPGQAADVWDQVRQR